MRSGEGGGVRNEVGVRLRGVICRWCCQGGRAGDRQTDSSVIRHAEEEVHWVGFLGQYCGFASYL